MLIKQLQLTKGDIKKLMDVSKLSKKQILEYSDFDLRDNIGEAKKYFFGTVDIEDFLRDEECETFEDFCDLNGCVKLEDGRYIFLGL